MDCPAPSSFVPALCYLSSPVRALLTSLVAVTSAALLLAVPAPASAALSCGVPDAHPAWIDFVDGSVSFFQERFARPGITIATGGPILAAEARAAGAASVHWDMHLRKRVGTPSEPSDPTTIDKRADSLFDYAVSVSGCEKPLIALNELWGASLPTPLTPTAEHYRENVLRFVTRLSERGGRPALLVSSKPDTAGDAAAWWRAIGQVSDIVLENYANANVIWREGPIEGPRRLRRSYRRSAAKLFAVGVQPARVGLIIGFQTGPGAGGREGLKPRSRWFDVAKWQGLAAKQVAKEIRLAHVWSWGWAQRDARSDDPDKSYAACVWLWTRDPSLCDAPRMLGDELDPDRRTGQIDLRAGVRCIYYRTPITAPNVAALARLTGDRELALTALVVRAAERDESQAGNPTAVLAAEKRIIAARFGGSRPAYRRALGGVGASIAVTRGIIGDELRRLEIVSRLEIARPTSVDVARFRATFAPMLARRLVASPAPAWLPDGTGLAIATSAPESVFRIRTRRWTRIRTAQGVYRVRALEAPAALAAVPLSVARPAILRELAAERRADAYGEWTLRQQRAAERRLVCERDRMPEFGVVTLSSFAPFLSLHEAATWDGSSRDARLVPTN
jgi:hypothetical protein